MKAKNSQDSLPDIEFSFPLEGISIKAKTLEEARRLLAERKNQNQEQGEN